MNYKKPMHLLMSLTVCAVCSAQTGTVATGGDATSTSGSISYSIGQIDYVNLSGTSNNLNQGLQQPYEFFIITTVNETNLEITMSLFPNPVRDAVLLKIQNGDLTEMSYSLYDESGKLLDSQKITASETRVDMQRYAMAGYFLKVTKQNSEIKTFQIIKNF